MTVIVKIPRKYSGIPGGHKPQINVINHKAKP